MDDRWKTDSVFVDWVKAYPGPGVARDEWHEMVDRAMSGNEDPHKGLELAPAFRFSYDAWLAGMARGQGTAP